MTDTVPLARVDANGASVRIGDRVEIIIIPAWLTHDLPPEDQVRLKSLAGKVVSVAEIDRFGYLWFSSPASGFCLRPEEVRRV